MTVTDAPVDQLAVLETKIDMLTEQLAFLTAEAEARARQRAMLEDLTGDINGISGDALTKVIDLLGEAEHKGYFAFARAGAEVADRVIANFDEDDLSQLGDNVVVILETIREITQPELLTLLGRMVDAVRAEQLVVEQEGSDPPSLLALSRQLRDPDVRRGMARALQTLRAVSVETGPRPTTSPTT